MRIDRRGIDEIRKISIQIRMDIDENRLDWNHLRGFLATAETKSLSAAARRLGLTQPTLSRQVAALEKHLGLLLFERVGRGLQLTDAGRELLTHVGDIAIRHMRPEQPDLVARLASEPKGYFYAAKSLLDRVGRPATVGDVAAMDWVGYGNIEQMVSYLTAMDLPVTPDRFRVSSADGLVAWEMGRTGLGVCPMEGVVGDAEPLMERLLPDVLNVTYPVWLVAHREIHTSPKIRLVFDVLAKALKDRGSAA